MIRENMPESQLRVRDGQGDKGAEIKGGVMTL